MLNPLKLVKYGKYFSPSRFMSFINTMGKNLVFMRQALILFFCLRDEDTPKLVKAILAGALGYLMIPTDIIPDKVPLVGWLDDAAVVAFALKIANRYIKPSHRESAQKFTPFLTADSK